MPSPGQTKLYVLNIKQKQIADAAGVNQTYVSRCLSGTQKPSERLVEAAVKLTGISAKELFPLYENGNRKQPVSGTANNP